MELTKRIDSVFCRWDHPDTPGGQVLVKHHGKVIYDRCFGLANLEHHIPITPTTRFHVASVSKQITVLSLLLLAEQGKVDLDADVRTYLPDLGALEGNGHRAQPDEQHQRHPRPVGAVLPARHPLHRHHHHTRF